MTPLITCFARPMQNLSKRKRIAFFLRATSESVTSGMGATGGLSFATFGNGRDLGSSTAATLRELVTAMGSTEGV